MYNEAIHTKIIYKYAIFFITKLKMADTDVYEYKKTQEKNYGSGQNMGTKLCHKRQYKIWIVPETWVMTVYV